MSSSPPNPVKAVRDWFKKKKVEKNFTKAGPGYKLTDEQARRASGGGGSGHGGGGRSTGGSSRPPVTSDASRAAAEAALRRFEQPTAKPRVTHLDDILNEERKKLVEDEKQKQQLESTKKHQTEIQTRQRKVIEEIEARQTFSCTTMGIDDPLPMSELLLALEMALLKEFSDEHLLLAATVLKNCNSAPIDDCWSTIQKIINNLLDADDPDQREKFSRIRKTKIATKVLQYKGAEMFLDECGFKSDADGIWLTFSGDMETVGLAREVLENVQSFPLELNRQIVIRTTAEMSAHQSQNQQLQDGDRKSVSNSSTAFDHLNDEFFRLTVAELSHKQAELTEVREREETLRTRAMRESEHEEISFRCRFSRLRIRLPSEHVMEATFLSSETPFDVLRTCTETLNGADDGRDRQQQPAACLSAADRDPGHWTLFFATKPIPDTDLTRSLRDLKLVPSALLILRAK